MSGITFQCRKCGTCCKNPIEDVNGIATGLLLTVKEISLFPSEMVSPKFAIGFKKPKKIIHYQLNVNDCPHINEKNECRIYEKRPLMCKAFPYESGTISVKCPEIGNRVKVNQRYGVEISAAEIEASEEMNRHILNRFSKFFRKGQKGWNFDLKKREWIMITRDNFHWPS
jgi:Fe-S-cluster containining protein